jgi:hypothetical protein
MKRRCILIIVLLALGVQSQLVVGQNSSPECFSIIERSFQKVSTEKVSLYEVNNDYFLQAEFEKPCELSRIDISPKYFWEHVNPQWKEPARLVSLSDDQYTELLSTINQIKLLGALISKGQTGLVTNATLRLVDRYEQGYVERRLYDSVGEQDEPKKVTSFSVYFIRSIDGKVSDKDITGISEAEKRARLKINGRWYWVDEAEYGKAVVGVRGVFRAAGPIG